MDIIDTSIRVGGGGTGSREKLHPKQDYDEEAVIVFLYYFLWTYTKIYRYMITYFFRPCLCQRLAVCRNITTI